MKMRDKGNVTTRIRDARKDRDPDGFNPDRKYVLSLHHVRKWCGRCLSRTSSSTSSPTSLTDVSFPDRFSSRSGSCSACRTRSWPSACSWPLRNWWGSGSVRSCSERQVSESWCRFHLRFSSFSPRGSSSRPFSGTVESSIVIVREDVKIELPLNVINRLLLSDYLCLKLKLLYLCDYCLMSLYLIIQQ